MKYDVRNCCSQDFCLGYSNYTQISITTILQLIPTYLLRLRLKYWLFIELWFLQELLFLPFASIQLCIDLFLLILSQRNQIIGNLSFLLYIPNVCDNLMVLNSSFVQNHEAGFSLLLHTTFSQRDGYISMYNMELLCNLNA